MRPDGGDSGAYACETITEPESLLRLGPEWEALQAETPESYVAESFTWARLCWSHPPRSRPRSLFCMAVRKGGALMAVWPLARAREGAWLVGSPLVSSTEYCPFLVHPEADPAEVWNALWGALRHAGLDALRLLNVRRDSALGVLLSGRVPRTAELYTSELMSLGQADLADWQAYRARWSAKTRQTLTRARRKLHAAATVTFEDVTDPAERLAVWRWMIEQKRLWARRRDLKNKWLFSGSFERFIAAGLEALGPSGARKIFVLRAGGELAAAALVSVDRTRVEAFMSVYNEAFAGFSPANLLHEDCIRWAGERGLAFDMRLGARRQKESWVASPSQAVSYAIPLSAHGRLFNACLRLAVSDRRGDDAQAA